MKTKNLILLHRIAYTMTGLACITFALDWRAGLVTFGAMLILRRMLITLGGHVGAFALAHFRPDQTLPPEDVAVLGPPSTVYSAGRRGLEQLRKDLADKGARFIEVRIASEKPAEQRRERVERPGQVERPPAKPSREDPPAAPPQPPEEKKRQGATLAEAITSSRDAAAFASMDGMGWPPKTVVQGPPELEGDVYRVTHTGPPETVEQLRQEIEKRGFTTTTAPDWPAAATGEEKGGQLQELVSVEIVPVPTRVVQLMDDRWPPAPPDADFPLDGPPKE